MIRAQSAASPAPSRAFDGLFSLLERWSARIPGPAAAAALVVAAALPGLLLLPPLDRDESRFAQATAQMLETGDYVNIRYQSDPRDKKPVGIHWMQAASVGLLSAVERRQIWAYRIPSLLGAMAAAAACAWGARPFFGPRGGVFAGMALGSSFILSSEAFIGKTDAVLCGAVTASMAALGRVYGAHRGVGQAGASVKALFFLGQAVAILDKGPIGPMVAGLALAALWIADRGIRWAGSLGWAWGFVLIAVIVGPWAGAITVATDGAFWTGAVQGDLAPKLAGGHETHGAPPGLHVILILLLLFPAAFLAPAAGVYAWRSRRETPVRFALAWLVPSWVVFEAMPTKLVHYTLPLYGALAWLAAGALTDPQGRGWGPRTRIAGAVLGGLGGLAYAVAAVVLCARYGDAAAEPFAAGAAILALAAGAVPAVLLLRRAPRRALAAGLVLGICAHVAVTAGLAPRLDALWTSARVARRLTRDGLDPRNGVVAGPVAVVGYAEPSLVFALGTATELDSPQDGADAMADGQPAVVEGRQAAAFKAALADKKVTAQPVDEVKGFDYSSGKPVDLTIWRAPAARPAAGPAPETGP